jgi:hypothetical protein
LAQIKVSVITGATVVVFVRNWVIALVAVDRVCALDGWWSIAISNGGLTIEVYTGELGEPPITSIGTLRD